MVVFSSLCLLHLWIVAFISILFYKRKLSNLFFGIFLLLFSSIHGQHILLQLNLLSSFPYVDPICGVTICLSFPAYYIYVKNLCGNFDYKNKKEYWHACIALPAVINLLYLLIFKNGEDLKEYYYKDEYAYTIQNALLLGGMTLLLVIYLWFANQEIKKYERRLKNQFSEIEKYKLEWLAQLNYFLIILAVVIAPILILLSKQNWNFIVIGIYTSFMYIYILYKSINNPVLNEIKNYISAEEGSRKAPGFKLTEAKENEIYFKLENYLSANKPWLSPELSLKQVADEISIPTYQLSYVINKKYKKNFFDLINDHRIEFVKIKLQEPAFTNLSFEALSEECGFGSKATFNRAFKKATGISPTEFKKGMVVQTVVP